MSIDPLQYLEDDAASRDWVSLQNHITQAQLDADPRFATLSADILANFQHAQHIPYFAEHAGWLYHFYQSADFPRGVYRKTTLAQYQSTEPQWEIVFNLDAVAEQEELDWQLARISHCTTQPNRSLISLSLGGADASVCREFDLATCTWTPNGFSFPLGKNQIHWRDENSLFVCPAWDESQLTTAGYSCEAWIVARGQAWEDATLLAVLPENILKVMAWRFLDFDGSAFDLLEVSLSFYRRNYYQIGVDNALTPIKLPASCELQVYSHGDLIIKLASDWAGFALGSLLAVQYQQNQTGRIQLLLPSEAHIQSLSASREFLIVSTLENVKTRIRTLQFIGDQWQEVPNSLPSTGVIEIIDQPWQSDIVYYTYSDFLRLAALYRCDLLQNSVDLLRQQPDAFDSSSFEYQQRWATSSDGVQIPYFVVHHKDIVLDGSNPCLLYGYGGFQVPLLPHYVDNLGPHWLVHGGVFVVANLRGGGEFGPAWHQAALRDQRQVSANDFIAIAEDLIAWGITSPRRLGIEGGSHGGLLVGMCLTQRPELFNAAVCEVPLLDMLRYTELHAGASWIDEYGDPRKDDDLRYLAAYSPYHHVAASEDQLYPRALLTTNRQDDRVHPAHARKMAARLQQQGQSVLFFENEVGGHTGSAGQQQTAQELARVLVFLYQQLID